MGIISRCSCLATVGSTHKLYMFLSSEVYIRRSIVLLIFRGVCLMGIIGCAIAENGIVTPSPKIRNSRAMVTKHRRVGLYSTSPLSTHLIVNILNTVTSELIRKSGGVKVH